MIELIDSQKLDFWIRTRRNVLFEGKHGVGKTSAIKAAFERAGLKYLYFSAATCDPFIDFVGVPRIVQKDGKDVLELVRQEYLQDESVEAIFIDEYNRAPKKMRNAVMELIQFKSVNGNVYPNLKVVWAAINPEDDQDTYDVEPLDPAQVDRFHIKCEIPYQPCETFFANTYGEHYGNAAIEWWYALSDRVRDMVSPRRLAYAMDFWLDGGDVRDVLPEPSLPHRLLELLSTVPVDQKLQELFDKGDHNDIALYINQENNLTRSLPLILNSSAYVSAFIPHLNAERLMSLASENATIATHVIEEGLILKIHSHYIGVIQGALTANPQSEFSLEARRTYIKGNNIIPDLHDLMMTGTNPNADKLEYHQGAKPEKAHEFESYIKVGYNQLKDLTSAQKDRIWTKLRDAVGEMNCGDGRFANIVEIILDGQRKGTDPWLKYMDFVPVVNTICRGMFHAGYLPEDIKKALSKTYEKLERSQYDQDDALFIMP